MKGFFVNGAMFFGVQPSFQWMLALQPGYTWDSIAISLRLGGSVVAADDPIGAIGGFVLGLEGRYYLLDGRFKPYPVVTMQGLLGSNSLFLMTLGFGIQFEWTKNIGFYGELSPIGVLGGGGLGGNYYFNFGVGAQYRF